MFLCGMVQVEVTWPGQTSEYNKIMDKPSPRIIKTHLYSKFFTKSEQQKSKFIIVLRDPKDILVSYFNQYNDKLGYMGSFVEYFEMYKHNDLIFGDPFDHAISWAEHKDKDNFLFTTYEQMKENIREVIKRPGGAAHRKSGVASLRKLCGCVCTQKGGQNERFTHNMGSLSQMYTQTVEFCVEWYLFL